MTSRMGSWRFFLSLVLVLLLAACGRKVELMTAIREPEANEIMAALRNAGVDADKQAGKEGLVSVSIPADEVGRAVDLLREKGLPRERFTGMGQVFKKEGLISSPLEERARYLFALSQELGATLSQIDGVTFARVHVVLPERTVSGEAAVPSSAAVFIKHQNGHDLESAQPLIRRLVTHSIPGLTSEKVSIVMIPAQPSRVSDPGAANWSGTRGSQALVAVLAVLFLSSLGAAGFLGWKYWWPQRAGRHTAPEVT